MNLPPDDTLRAYIPSEQAPAKPPRQLKFTSRAVLLRLTQARFRDLLSEDWTFALACDWWSLDVRQCGAVLIDRQLDSFEKKLARCHQWINRKGEVVLRGYRLNEPRVLVLRQTHEELLRKYDTRLHLLRVRGRNR